MGVKINRGKAKDGGFIITGDIHITRRELEVLSIVATGIENRKAAEILGVSYQTVRNHIYNITKKLGATNHANAVVRAIENKMIEIEID